MLRDQVSFGSFPSFRLTGLLRTRSALRISPGWGVLGVLAFVLWLGSPAEAWSQSIVATIPVPGLPNGLALNKVTNKIYVVGDDRPGPEPVFVIDGTTDSTTDVQTSSCQFDGPVVLNEVTNQIYDLCFDYQNNGSILVIDGVTNSQTTVSDPNARGLAALAVNSATNKIYVANAASNNVSVIDGATNSIATVADPNASSPLAVAINPVTNKIYVLNQGTVTVIDGITNSTSTVRLVTSAGQVAQTIAVNASTNKIYAATGSNVSVIDGATNTVTTLAVPAVDLAVNATTNKIYAPTGNDVIVIDGATNSTTRVTDPLGPSTVAVNETTNMIYVGNNGEVGSQTGWVTVINGNSNSATLIALQDLQPGVTAVAVDTVTNRIYAASILNVTVIDGAGTPTMHALAVALATNGGTVTSNPAGINCGQQSCPASAASFPTGTVVRLSVTSVPSGTAVSWSGACSGTGPCEVTMNSDAIAIESLVNNVTVPNLAGLSEGSARTALTNAALVLGTVTQKSSATVASGNVISQSPAAGADVTPGSGVNVVLSTGPASAGGGGGMDWLTLGALLGFLVLAGRRAAHAQPAGNPLSR